MPTPFTFFAILLFSILGSVLAVRFKQPAVLGVLLAGALIGPHALGIIQDTSALSLVIEIGSILLLFLVGLEFNLTKLLHLGSKTIIIAILKIGIVFSLGYFVGLLFGFTSIGAVLLGVILSITSTAIFIKILEQKGLASKEEVPLLVAVLIIEDLYGIFALTFFSNSIAGNDLTFGILFFRIVLSLFMLGFMYLILLKVLPPVIEWLCAYSSEDTLTFIAWGVCAVLSYLAHFIGLSPSVGAFLAGNLIGSLKKAQLFEKSVHPFILASTSLFFFAIGTFVDFGVLKTHLLLLIILTVVNIAAKFVGIGLATFFFSETDGKSAVFSGLAMISVGEFSLLLAKEGQALHLGIDLISIITIMIFISSIVMAISIPRYEQIYQFMSNLLPSARKESIRTIAKYTRCVSLECMVTTLQKKETSGAWKQAYYHLLGILFIGLMVLSWYNATQFRYIKEVVETFKLLPYSGIVLIGIAILGFLALLGLTFGIIRNIKNLFLVFFKKVLKLYPDEIVSEKKVYRNLLFAAILFVFSLVVPSFIAHYHLSSIWIIAPVVILVGVFFYLSRALTTIRTLVQKKKSSRTSKSLRVKVQQESN